MKKRFLATLLLCSAQAMAHNAAPVDAEMCAMQARLAEEIMGDRQDGLSKADIKAKLLQMTGDANDPGFVLFLSHVFRYQDAAFELPVASSARGKLAAKQAFKDKAYNDCLQSK